MRSLRARSRLTIKGALFLFRDLYRVLRGRGVVYLVTWSKEDEGNVEFGQFPGRGTHYPVENMIHDRTINDHKLASLRIAYKDESMPEMYNSVARYIN